MLLFRILRLWRMRRKIYQRWVDTDATLTLGTALVVGIGAGFGAVIFRRLITGIHQFSFSSLPSWLASDFPLHLLLVPAIGGALVGPLVYYFAREAKGHGVPEVMEALELRNGIIRPRVVLIKALESSICIGTGGSVGREGPIAQIGSALGSVVGQVLRLPKDRIRTLVACGAAGGVAATFNAPIAGAIFALEVLLRRFNSLYFGAVVISAVTADVIAHYFEGDQRAFLVPAYSLISSWELLLYALLGFVSAGGGMLFSRLLYFSEDLWARIRFPEPLKPVLGGIILGVVGLYTFKLDGIPPAPRGMPQIEVTFDIDANGILHVSAKDKGTGKEQKITITHSSGLSEDEIEQMKKDAEEHAEDDKKQFEAAEARNTGENLVYAAEKLIKENAEKISDDKKKEIESGVEELKETLKGDDLEKIKSQTEKLQESLQAASADMYKAAAEEAQQQEAAGAGNDNKEDDSPAEDGPVVDAEVVDEKKK